MEHFFIGFSFPAFIVEGIFLQYQCDTMMIPITIISYLLNDYKTREVACFNSLMNILGHLLRTRLC